MRTSALTTELSRRADVNAFFQQVKQENSLNWCICYSQDQPSKMYICVEPKDFLLALYALKKELLKTTKTKHCALLYL